MSESRGWLQPFWENSLPRLLSSPASPLPVIYVPCCPDGNINTQRPGRRLQVNAHCVCVRPVLGDRGNKQHSHTCWAGSQSICRDTAEEKDIQESAVKADSEWSPLATSMHLQVDTFPMPEPEETSTAAVVVNYIFDFCFLALPKELLHSFIFPQLSNWDPAACQIAGSQQ